MIIVRYILMKLVSFSSMHPVKTEDFRLKNKIKTYSVRNLYFILNFEHCLNPNEGSAISDCSQSQLKQVFGIVLFSSIKSKRGGKRTKYWLRSNSSQLTRKAFTNQFDEVTFSIIRIRFKNQHCISAALQLRTYLEQNWKMFYAVRRSILFLFAMSIFHFLLSI